MHLLHPFCWRASHSLIIHFPTDMPLICSLHPYRLTCTLFAYHNFSPWHANYFFIASFLLMYTSFAYRTLPPDMQIICWLHPYTLTCPSFAYHNLSPWCATYAFIASFLLTCTSFAYHILTLWFTHSSIFSNHVTFNPWHSALTVPSCGTVILSACVAVAYSKEEEEFRFYCSLSTSTFIHHSSLLTI